MSIDNLKKDQAERVESNGQQVEQVSGQYVADPEVMELEAKLAHYCGVKHALACVSGADALLFALMSYDVGPGDAILTTPFNDTAALSAIRRLGATPVFVDIDQSTFNLDPEHLESAIEAVLKGDPSIYPLPGNRKTAGLKLRGIISPDLFGMPADYDIVNAIAAKYELFVIEDGSQAFGGLYKDRRVGSLAKISFTSFNEDATLGVSGNGGICFTDQDHLAQRMRSLREQGVFRAADISAGESPDGRLDALQAVALLAKLEALPEEIRRRQEAAKLYTRFMDENPLLITPYIPNGVVSAWSRYCLMTESDEDRAVMLKKLKNAGISAGICYAKPLHVLDEFADLQYQEGDFPISEDYVLRTFSLPMHPDLTKKHQEEVADLLNDWQ